VRGEALVVFGAGSAGQRVIRSIGRRRVRFVVDNDPAKWGSRIQGLLVVGPSELVNGKHRILVATVFAADVYGQLLGLGLDSSRIQIASPEAMNGALTPPISCVALFLGLSLLVLILLIVGMT
jgi:hypothetical protein